MNLRIPDKHRGTPIQFTFDSKPITAYEGETVAMALWAAGIQTVFCGMGVCQVCVVWIDGRRCESCMTRVRADLAVSGKPNAKL